MPRVFYPGLQVTYTDFPPNMPHAQQFNQNSSGHYLPVSPIQFHPQPLLAPPFPFFLPSPGPTSSGLAQSYVDQYTPMAQRQLSFHIPEAPGNCWQLQDQRQHPSVFSSFNSQWPSPTSLSPAMFATLLGPADGMSTNRLDEMPSYLLGRVLEKYPPGLSRPLKDSAPPPPPPPPEQEQQPFQKQELNRGSNMHSQRNASCDAFYSEASPHQLVTVAAAPAHTVHIQACHAPLLLESPFMPLAGNLGDFHPRYGLSSPSEEEGNNKRTGSGSGSGNQGVTAVVADPLAGMDMELLYRHFQEDTNEDANAELGSSAATTAAAVVEKEKEDPHLVVHQQLVANDARDHTQNMDLQTLFQSFAEDLEALPPLDLNEIGKSAAPAADAAKYGLEGGNLFSPSPLSPPRYGYDSREEYLSPMSPAGHYPGIDNKKRGSSAAEEFVYDPHTPEKKNISGGLGQQRSSPTRKNCRVALERNSSTTTTATVTAPKCGGYRSKSADTAPNCSEMLAMLPAAAKRRRSSLKNSNCNGSDADEAEEKYSTSPSSNLPIRCIYLFEKTITPSDAGKLSRIVLPRAAVEQYLPRCDNKTGIPLALWDQCGNCYGVVLKFWLNGRPVAKRMWLLDQCQELIAGLKLVPGSVLEFYEADDGRLVVKSN
jgi:hypothetical protein